MFWQQFSPAARRVNAIAAAIAMATVAISGAFLAMRATFDPYAGALQLIFAFEASVIGGAGSLWGTLLGGDRARRRPKPRRLRQPAGLLPRRAPGVSRRAVRASLLRRLRPAPAPRLRREARRERASALAVERWTRESRVALAVAALVVVAARARAVDVRRQHRRPADDAVHLRDPRGDVERAGRLLRAGVDRPAGVLRPRRLFRGAPRRFRRQRLSRRCSSPRSSSACCPLPLSALMLRLKGGEFAIGMWVVSEIRASARQSRHADQRRDGHVADRAQRLRRPMRAAPDLLVRLRRDDRPAGDRLLRCCADRSARRSRRSATTRRPPNRSACASCAPSVSSSSSPPSARRSPARCGWRPRSPSSRRPISARNGPPT